MTYLREHDPEIFLTGTHTTIDLETTSRNYGNACDPENQIVLLGTHKRLAGKTIAEATECNEYTIGKHLSISNSPFVVGHNIKFDLKWLIRSGIDVSGLLIWDTMLAEYCLAGNQKFTQDLSLHKVAQSYGLPGKGKYIDSCIKGGVSPADLPLSLLKDRVIYDVATTNSVFHFQKERAKQAGLLPVIYTKGLVTVVLAYLEMNGIHLDKKAVEVAYHDTYLKHEDICKQLHTLTGGINPRSPKQVAEFVYDVLKFPEPTKRAGRTVVPDRTPSGGRKADSDTIATLVPKTAKQKAFVELKQQEAKFGAMLTKTLNTYKSQVDSGNPILFANFNQTATKTHRLSSTGAFGGVQFQNQARQFKKLVTAREHGWKVGEADYAQVEFRVAAWFGNDPVALNDILTGADIHRYTASIINSIPESEVTDEQRTDAKPHTFKPLYAGESGTKEEEAYYAAFKKKYAGVASVQELWCAKAAEHKSNPMPTGLHFYYPTARYDNNGRLNVKTEVYNHPIQYFATGEIALIGLVHLFHKLRWVKAKSFLTNTVHDAAVAEVAPGEEELFTECAKVAFVDDTLNYLRNVYGIEFNVPLAADVKIGHCWGAKE